MDVASPVAGRLEAKATFRRNGSVFEFDELRAGLTPSDPEGRVGVLALAVRGRLDLATGEGTFVGRPRRRPSGRSAWGRTGRSSPGWAGPTGRSRVDAALLGDLAALDRLLASWSGSPPKGLGGPWSSRLAVARSAAGKARRRRPGRRRRTCRARPEGAGRAGGQGRVLARGRPARPGRARPGAPASAGSRPRGEPAGDEGAAG